MANKNIIKNQDCDDADKSAEQAAIKLWILRILVEMGGISKFLGKNFYESNQIASYLGLQEHSFEENYDSKFAYKRIVEMYESFSKNITGLPTDTTLVRNLNRLAKVLSLSKLEVQILHFTILVKTNPVIHDAIDLLAENKPSLIGRIYACCLKLDTTLISQALSFDGILNKSGLVDIEPGSYYSFDAKINILPGLLDTIDATTMKPIDLFRTSFCKSGKPKLSEHHYQYLKEDIEILSDYLNVVHKIKKHGVNVLIYGPPGMGKTEFTRMLSKLTKSSLYEISYKGEGGKPLKGIARFKAYQAAQNLLNNNNRNAILFDEVEDVFVHSPSVLETSGNPSGNKAWINNILETNPVPAFWLTNNLTSIDKAFLRRFDYVIEMTVPPQKVRAEILESYLKNIPVTSSLKKQISQYENLPPATIERACEVIKVINLDSPNINADKLLHKIIGNSLEAMSLTRPVLKADRLELDYKLEMLNADCNIAEVCEGIISNGHAKVCLYGPPGTGKSALGRYIAQTSGKQLIVKKASDIISPYVGESEKNMARMFEQATSQDAILLLDEADTYLQDRKNSRHSWEVSGVNEMLTQIEEFNGVFICSTNLLENIDAAALRRFDLKIKFTHLSQFQAWNLFVDAARCLSITVDESLHQKIYALTELTPGDFATVLRQSRFRPVKNSEDLYNRIITECLIKKGHKQSIGFH